MGHIIHVASTHSHTLQYTCNTRNPPGKKSRKPQSILTGTKGKKRLHVLVPLLQRLIVALDMTSWAPIIPTINNTALSVSSNIIVLRRVCGNRNRNRNRGVLERGSSRENPPIFIQVLIKKVETNRKILYTNTYCMMYCKHFSSRLFMYQSGMAANPARGQLNREKYVFPVPVLA